MSFNEIKPPIGRHIIAP